MSKQIKKKIKKGNRGITLIALVVTIIVLLLLAGISIGMLTGNNGILKQSREAKTQTIVSGVKEKIQLELYGSFGKDGNIDAKTAIDNIKNRVTGAQVTGKDFPFIVEVDDKKFTVTSSGVEEYKRVTNPYKNQQWVKAWTVNNGVWSDTIEAGGTAEGDIIAKLYETGNTVTPGIVGSPISFEQGPGYELVIEGEGDMPLVADMINMTGYAWQKEGLLKIETMASPPETFISDDFITFYITKVTICDGITSIGDGAFVYGISINDFKLASSIEEIGDYAFGGTAVTNFVMPSGVITIGKGVFSESQSLTNVTLSSSLTSISERAFGQCTRLVSIKIPNGVTTIEGDAFFYCESLVSLELPDSVTTLGNGAFNYCTSLRTLTIPKNVTALSGGLCNRCTSLTKVVIPEGVTSIGNMTFDTCTSLSSINIPSTMRTIGNAAFEDCTSLPSLTIPDEVTSIGTKAFKNVPHVYYHGSATGSPWGATLLN